MTDIKTRLETRAVAHAHRTMGGTDTPLNRIFTLGVKASLRKVASH